MNVNKAIKMRLHEQVIHQRAQIERLENGLNDIRRYLNSSKFYHDVSVNKNDILMRINEIKQNELLTN